MCERRDGTSKGRTDGHRRRAAGEIRRADRRELIELADESTERFGEREAAFDVEATAGWRYVVEELEGAASRHT